MCDPDSPENGRGLVLVTALSEAWGFTPADQCRAGGPGDPAPAAHGGCVWACPEQHSVVQSRIGE